MPVGGDVGITLSQLKFDGGVGAVSEAELQQLIHQHPAALPIAEIDPMFVGAVPICTELNTPAGPIDNLLVTPSGLPVLVECKLWRNPEGRREVVGQILDYAKELSRWSAADLQREVRRRLKANGNPLLEMVRAAAPELDEVDFNDALTFNLRRGRFLLLIVGDGIREGVEAIADYLQAHAGLHFSFGLVELPIYLLPDGAKLVVPRVLAHTHLITRHVVSTPDGFAVRDENNSSIAAGPDPDREALANEQQTFWTDFLAKVQLDDPEQVKPKAAKQGYITFMLPAPGGSSWLTVYRNLKSNEVGILLSCSRNTAGEFAMRRIVDDWPNVCPELGQTAQLVLDKEGRQHPRDSLVVPSLGDATDRAVAFKWLSERVNTFVNVLRPRIRSAVSDYQLENGA